MALMTYVLKDRHGTYYFRRGIPLALRPFMPEPWTGKHEWKRSLKAKLPAEAKRNASRALSDCTAVFLAAERSSRGEPAQPNHLVRLDAGTLAELEADVVRLLLEADAVERSIGDDRRHLLTPKDREATPLLVPVAFGQKGMAEDHWHALGDMLEEDAAVYRRALSRSDPSCVRRERDAGLRRLGVKELRMRLLCHHCTCQSSAYRALKKPRLFNDMLIDARRLLPARVNEREPTSDTRKLISLK